MDKLIISVAVTGGMNAKSAAPFLPITEAAIIESTYGAWEAGASVAHLHVRDDEGAPTGDLERYRRVCDALAERCDLILQLTTGPGLGVPEEDRIKVLDLAPELASLDAGTVHLGGTTDLGEYTMWGPLSYLRKLTGRMLEVGTKPQCEIFHDGMIANCEILADEGFIERPIDYHLIMGPRGHTPSRANLETLLNFLRQLPDDCTWTAYGCGLGNLEIAPAAIVRGGHVRVGLEDEIEYLPGVPATSNAQLVARMVRLAKELGREVATPTEARQILGLRPRDSPTAPVPASELP